MNKQSQRPVNMTYYNTNYQYNTINKEDGSKMHGSRRVITFCLLTTVLPCILIVLPLYLRNIRYADVRYKISNSDVIQIHKGQSSVFCEKHSLKMNTTFSAFQMEGTPEISNKRKHIRLKKSMTLPDDTLEYWGFYLLKGATVELKACSRHDGSKILVVKGERTLNTCGILEGYKHRKGPPRVANQGRVLVTVENPDQERVNSSLKESQSMTKEFENSTNDKENTLFDSDEYLLLNKTNYGKEKDDNGERQRRDIRNVHLHNPNTVLDTGVHHGGNALNSTTKPNAPMSSFENTLHECYHDKILMNNFFPSSSLCNSTNYLEQTTTLKVDHEVFVDGYYYYIFYSDNGLNDIHALFDIFKPTFQYVNNSETKVCVNQTECEFDIEFFSDELVIVEVPTKEGLQNEESDSAILISVCHPRMSIYIFFPIAVLLLILLFAFL